MPPRSSQASEKEVTLGASPGGAVGNCPSALSVVQGPVTSGTACLSSPSPVLSGPLAHLQILLMSSAPLFSPLPRRGSSPFL